MAQAHPPLRQIRARYDDDTITVYQAYSDEIADPALAAGRFVSPFKLTRMTWIKPSFLWMMYRSGWATKPGQERILAISLLRNGFETALASSCLSHFDAAIYRDHDEWLRMKNESPVRIQWDPERDLAGSPMAWRSLQIGLGGEIASRYANEWVVKIADVTELARSIHDSPALVEPVLAAEQPYPLPEHVARRIGASPE